MQTFVYLRLIKKTIFMIKTKKLIAAFAMVCVWAGCSKIDIQGPYEVEQSTQQLQVNDTICTLSYSEIQNKYIDIALEHELNKPNESSLRFAKEAITEMTIDEKINAIQSLSEQKNSTSLKSTNNDVSEDDFYNLQTATLIEELNRNPLVIEAIERSDKTEPLESMIISYNAGDSLVSKMEVLQHIEENQNTNTQTKTRSIRLWLAARWGNEIHYRFTESVSSNLKDTIKLAMEEWQSAANYKFRFKEIANSGWNKFVWAIGCYYHIRVAQIEDITIAGCASIGCVPWSNCNISNYGLTKGTCLHELGHNLGLLHEHQRADRDNYVTIKWDNIKDEFKTQFIKLSVLSESYGEFDFNSIMMYSSTAFTKNPINPDKNLRYTIDKKDGSNYIYNRKELSEGDKKNIKLIYQ